MYSYIKGIVSIINPKFIVIENNGIGYQVIAPNPYSFRINEEITIYLYQHVREDILDLYGFKTIEEKELFLKLLSVNGIGPKSALSIIASASVMDVISAIEDKNDAYLKRFPGIGPKASLQIILDLKGKLSLDDKSLSNSKTDIIVEALSSLGYSKKDARNAILKLDLQRSEGELIKDALKILND